ncbi:outer membrane protein assembly factor BamE [bacterium]|nr:outer membrane protein assembly factor BamE [bacterium]
MRIGILLGSFLLLSLLASCAATVRSPQPPSDELLALRQRYLPAEDPFRESILAGELQRGMSPTQVYLAWGRPLRGTKDDREQRWTYEFRDPGAPEAQPPLVTRLLFVDGRLLRWRSERGFMQLQDTPRGSDPLAGLPTLVEPEVGKPR